MILVGDCQPGPRRALIRGVDGLALANLEGPLLPCPSAFVPAAKAGPILFNGRLPKGSVAFAFSLANNHIMDFGADGLDSTITVLRERNSSWAGAGWNDARAREPLIVSDHGARVGIVCCCEPQFGEATRTEPGTATVGPWVYGAVSELARRCDAVVVSTHAGFELAPWPSPQLQDLYRSFIDAGARVVHGHHSHVPQGIEEYGGGLIIYGAGNFVVDPDNWEMLPNTLWSVGVEVDFGTQRLDYRVLTLEIRQEPDGALLVEPSGFEESAQHREYLEMAQRPLTDRALLEALWHETALRSYESLYRGYLRLPAGTNGTPSWTNRLQLLKRAAMSLVRALRGQPLDPSPTQHDYLLWYHLFACPTHRDAIATALGIQGGELLQAQEGESRRLADRYLQVDAA